LTPSQQRRAIAAATIGLVAMILMHESSPRHRLRVPQIGEPVPL